MGKIYGGFRAEPVKKGTPKANMKKHCKATKEYAEDQRARQVAAYGYSYVEPENVRYNKVLVDCGDKSYEEIIKECNQEKFGGRTIRHDGIPMIDTVFYYSPEKTKNLLCHLHRNNEHWKQEHADWWKAYESMPKEERSEIVKAEYKWVSEWAQASEKWAEENLGQVVHCVLHCHEGTPHLDCKTLAIKEKEKGKWIWAKREILGNKAHLSKIQTKYAEECGAKFGLERGEVREVGALRKHAETERHMAAVAREQEAAQLEQVQMQVLDMQDTINEKQATINDKQSTIASLDAEIKAKQKEAEEITEEVYKPYIDAQERLIRQFEALKPQDRKKEQSEIEKLLKESNRVFGDAKAMVKATAALEQESSRLESSYLSIEDDDDFGLD